MSVRTFFKIVGILIIAAAAWGVYLLIHQWEPQTIDGYEVRHNAITGAVQIRVGEGWRSSFEATDPYAAAVAPADLARVRFVDSAWGKNGLLCARALVAPGPAIKGRAVLTLNIIDVVWHKRIRERDLRENIDWPGGALTPFVLKTNLTAPTEKNQKTFLTLQPVLSGGD